MKRCPVCGGINEDYLNYCKFCGYPIIGMRAFTYLNFNQTERKGFSELMNFSSFSLLAIILSLSVLVPFILLEVGAISSFNFLVGLGALFSAILAIFSLVKLKRSLINFSEVRGIYKATVGSYMVMASTIAVFVLPIIAYPVLEVFGLPSPIDFLSLDQSEIVVASVEIVLEIFLGASIVLVGIGIHDIGSTFRVGGLSNGGILMAIGGILVPIFFPLSIIIGIVSLLYVRSGAREAIRKGYSVFYY